MAVEKHTLVALVEDKPGVLSRVASLFRRRGFNIESIAVGPAETPLHSRMTIVVSGGEAQVEQVRKQLEKLVEVIKVTDVSGDNVVIRELALIRVKTTPNTRSEILQLVDIFRASIVDVASDSMVVEVTGDEEKINSLLNLLKSFGIKEVARTGRLAMLRGGASSLLMEEGSRARRKR